MGIESGREDRNGNFLQCFFFLFVGFSRFFFPSCFAYMGFIEV